jgi:uncharacterized protein
MSDRRPIGYVVEIDGPILLVNLLEEARGHVAGHRDGLSTVEQPGDLIGVEAGAETIVVRIQTVAFAEPKEVHVGRSALRKAPAEPLRQLKGRVIGYLSRSKGSLQFYPQDWRLPVLGASAFPLSDMETLATIGGSGEPSQQVLLGWDSRNPTLEVKASVNDLLGRHLAVLGATGQGKTHFIAALLQRLLKASSRPRVIVFDVNGEYAPAFLPWTAKVRRTVLGQATKAERSAGVADFLIPYFALGRHGLARLLLPSERTQMPALRFAVEHLRYVLADERGARANGNQINVLFDDCRTARARQAYTQLESIRSRNTPLPKSGLTCVPCLALRRNPIP